MKRLLAGIFMVIMLSGCGKSNREMDQAMGMREKMLGSKGCTFDAIITADYGDNIYTFTVNCKAGDNGDISFSVTEPESIAGISGTITQQGGHLTFDDQAIAFGMLADGQVTPVTAPWLFIRTLRSGYLSSSGKDGEYIRISIDDSYEDEALHLDVWIDNQDHPVRGEILWQGRRVVSLEVKNFSYL